MWCEPDTTSWVVRGKSYMDDRQKQPSAESLFRLAAVERLFDGDAREQLDLGGRADSWLGQDVAARRAAGEAVPFTFVVNVYVPHASQLSIVCYFRARDEAELRRTEQPEVALFWAFVRGDDAFRNERFKLIPKIPTGSLLIRQAVGQKPALIGRKLTMPYTRRDHYFEVGVDVCSSTVADYTTRLVRDAIATSVVLDLAFTLEGRSAAELPERILARRADHIELGGGGCRRGRVQRVEDTYVRMSREEQDRMTGYRPAPPGAGPAAAAGPGRRPARARLADVTIVSNLRARSTLGAGKSLRSHSLRRALQRQNVRPHRHRRDAGARARRRAPRPVHGDDHRAAALPRPPVVGPLPRSQSPPCGLLLALSRAGKNAARGQRDARAALARERGAVAAGRRCLLPRGCGLGWRVRPRGAGAVGGLGAADAAERRGAWRRADREGVHAARPPRARAAHELRGVRRRPPRRDECHVPVLVSLPALAVPVPCVQVVRFLLTYVDALRIDTKSTELCTTIVQPRCARAPRRRPLPSPRPPRSPISPRSAGRVGPARAAAAARLDRPRAHRVLVAEALHRAAAAANAGSLDGACAQLAEAETLLACRRRCSREIRSASRSTTSSPPRRSASTPPSPT